ncbi:MAG: YceI family protein [Candidatus Jorgensenbacteria bacterium GW2011_GWA2_45_9]|uniref:YceI family protein n=2 Tax=Candidatus Joergenseniibacteriota TaxID=1752739 RepID=A0A0G1N5A1_9BACT|nr:MAG: YceI family protein [Candidatus Jorgensenbacteria bacterium GW2011_GWA2_45_9]
MLKYNPMKTKIIIAVLVLLVAGVAAFIYFLRPVAAPSINVGEEVAANTPSSPEPGALRFDVAPGGSSTAEFGLNEILRGAPKFVVGTTDQVSGYISIPDKDTPSKVAGEIKVNTRAFKTDDEQRNRAIARFVLKSEEPANEFIVFKPTEAVGLPKDIPLNQEFMFRIAGNITIIGVTKPVVFDVTATLSDNRMLTGIAETSLMYEDFGVSVPSLPFLANVEKQIKIKISFVARGS